MPRPRIDPSIRFADILPMWEFADANGGAEYMCLTEKEAIHKMHRLNMARAAMRGDSGAHVWDVYVVRKAGCKLIITGKEVFDATRFIAPDGGFIPKDVVERVISEDQKPLDEVEFRKTMAATQKQFDELQARKAAGNLERARERDDPTRDHLREIDPTKPLGLDEA